jgi:hypothetical protein
MRIALFVLLTTSILTLSVKAQTPSIEESGAFQPGQTLISESSSPSSVWHEVITNHGSSSIVAFHATFHCPAGGGFKRIDIEYVHDSLFRYGHDANIPPGGSVEITAADPSQCPGGVDAVIFSDGHSEGDQQRVSALYAQRRGRYKALGEAIRMLDAVASNTESTQAIIDTLDRLSHSIANDITINSYERSGITDFYSSLKGTLETPHGIVEAPSDHTSQRQLSYDEVVRTQHISREQAKATVIRNKLLEWKAALEGNTGPPSGR